MSKRDERKAELPINFDFEINDHKKIASTGKLKNGQIF